MLKKINRYVLSILLILILSVNVFANSVFAEKSVSNNQRVLYLSSYSYSWGSVPFQIKGISEVLGDKYILNYEFMDTKNTIYSEGYKEFYDLLKYKLKSRDKYDVIIAGDDAALNFIELYKNDLFRDTPVVFEGIDNIDNAVEAAKDPLFTGIVEKVDYDSNIKLARTLLPDATKLVLILDDFENGIGIEKQLEDNKELFEDYDVTYLNSANYTYEELCSKLEALDNSCIAFCISMGKGKNNRIYTEEERYAILREHVRIPLFRVSQSGVGEGAFLGGYVVNHEECGRLTGEMVKRILTGEKPSDIPVIHDTPHTYYFDYNIMDKYNVKQSQLPQNSTIINEKVSFISLHYRTIFAIVSLLIIVLLIILLYNKIQSNMVLKEKIRFLMRQTEQRQISLQE